MLPEQKLRNKKQKTYSPINLKAKLALPQFQVNEGSRSPGTTRFTEKTNDRYVAFTCRGPYNNPAAGKAAAVFSPFLEKEPEGQRRVSDMPQLAF